MTSLNPYESPSCPTEREIVAPLKGARYGIRAFIVWTLLAGVCIGGCITVLRLLVEGFYWWDAARDLLIGGFVGILVGIGWFLLRRCVFWVRDCRGERKPS